MRVLLASSQAANKQLERTVTRWRVRATCASPHCAHAARWTRGHAAAQLRRTARAAYRSGKSVSRFGALLTFAALPAAILVAALLFAPSVNGQSLDEMAGDLLHSDLPIFGRGGDNEWPR